MAEERPTPFYIVLTGVALSVIVGAAVLLMRMRSTAPPQAEPLSEEEKSYAGQIVVADARMSAAENFLGHTVTVMDARITNRGLKSVKRVELQLEFVDILGQVVLRERALPLAPHAMALKPGESRAFQVSFDHMPVEWNQAPPRITLISVHF